MHDPRPAAERLIKDYAEVQKLPKKEREDWERAHVAQFSKCMQSLLDFHAGYRKGAQHTSSLVLRLLKTIEPLLSARGDYRNFIEGTAPRLRELAKELKEHFGV